MLRFLLAAGLVLATATPAAAQVRPEDAALSALDGCYAIRKGASPSSVAASQGFSPLPKGPDRWIKTVGGVQLQIRLTHNPSANGQMLHLCTVGIWGRLASPMTLKVKLMARAVEEGYPLGEQAARSGGGTIQTMSRETATTLEGITLIMNEAADPATSTNYAIILGWSP